MDTRLASIKAVVISEIPLGNFVEGCPRTSYALACTQTLFYFSFRSFRKHRRASEGSERARTSSARENERGARERKIKPDCRHLWEKRGLLSPSAMSTTLHYHLHVRSTNEIGDINCLCNCILQSNNSDTVLSQFVIIIALYNTCRDL